MDNKPLKLTRSKLVIILGFMSFFVLGILVGTQRLGDSQSLSNLSQASNGYNPYARGGGSIVSRRSASSASTSQCDQVNLVGSQGMSAVQFCKNRYETKWNQLAPSWRQNKFIGGYLAWQRTIREDVATPEQERYCKYADFVKSPGSGYFPSIDQADVDAYNMQCAVATPTPTIAQKSKAFMQCDMNDNGTLEQSDIQELVNCIFNFEYKECIALDTNRDGRVDVGDDSAKTLCRFSPNNATEFFCDPNRDGLIMDAGDDSHIILNRSKCEAIPEDQKKCMIDPNVDGTLDAGDISKCIIEGPVALPTMPPSFNLQACNPYTQTAGVTKEDIDLIEEFIFGPSCKYADANGDGLIDMGDVSMTTLCYNNMSTTTNCRYLDQDKDGALNAVERGFVQNCIFSDERDAAVELINKVNKIVPDCNGDGIVNAADISAAIIVSYSQ